MTDPGSGVVYEGGATGAPSPVRYVAVPASDDANTGEVSLTYLCAAQDAGVAAGEVPWGWVYFIVAIDTATGTEISRTSVCVPLIDPTNPSIPPPPPLPAPPSITEIWEAVRVPAPELHVNPAGEGVCGLETWIWSGGPTTVGVDVSIRGWTITGTATLTTWSFDPGDGTGPHTTTTPGTAEHHGTDHTYEIKGTYPLSVTATWTAQVTLTGPGLTPTPAPIGVAALTTTRQYQVVEVVPVLLP